MTEITVEDISPATRDAVKKAMQDIDLDQYVDNYSATTRDVQQNYVREKEILATQPSIGTSSTWSSSWYTADNYSRIKTTIYANVTLDYNVDYSFDESNVWAQTDTYSTTASVGEGRDFSVYGNSLRVNLSNTSGSSASTCRVGILGDRR